MITHFCPYLFSHNHLIAFWLTVDHICSATTILIGVHWPTLMVASQGWKWRWTTLIPGRQSSLSKIQKLISIRCVVLWQQIRNLNITGFAPAGGCFVDLSASNICLESIFYCFPQPWFHLVTSCTFSSNFLMHLVSLFQACHFSAEKETVHLFI